MELGIILGLGNIAIKKVSQKYINSLLKNNKATFVLDINKLEKYLENPKNKLVDDIQRVYNEYGTDINKLWLDTYTGFNCSKKIKQGGVLSRLNKEGIIEIKLLNKDN